MINIDVGSDHCRVIPPSDAQGDFAHFEFFRHMYAYVEASRQIPPSACVLEVGSGEGYGANYLSALFPHITATDLSLQALNHAKVHYPGVQSCQTLGTNLPFASNLFEAIVSFQVIEHIEDTKSYAQELHRVLKPEGRLFLTTPNRKLRLLPFQKPWNPYHIREYSGNELRSFLEQWFASLQLYGIMAQPDLMAMEKARLKQRPLWVYGGLLKRWLQKIWPQLARQKPASVASNQQQIIETPGRSIQLDDFFLGPDINNCLDFFVVATKAV
jgi:ubiquinone/menaquinone biosynthesis C-methylase UbiE